MQLKTRDTSELSQTASGPRWKWSSKLKYFVSNSRSLLQPYGLLYGLLHCTSAVFCSNGKTVEVCSNKRYPNRHLTLRSEVNNTEGVVMSQLQLVMQNRNSPADYGTVSCFTAPGTHSTITIVT